MQTNYLLTALTANNMLPHHGMSAIGGKKCYTGTGVGNYEGAAVASRKWGHGSNILTTAHQRRSRHSTSAEDWDGDFGCVNDMNDDNCDGDGAGNDTEDDDENPFDSIGKFLDEREKEISLQQEKNIDEPKRIIENERLNDTNKSIGSGRDDRPLVGNPSPLERAWDFNHQFGGKESSPESISYFEQKDCSIIAQSNSQPIGYRESMNESTATTSSQLHTARKRREYSVMKTTTPRFSFKSSTKRTNKTAFVTPSNKSLPSKTLFPSASSSSSKKRQTRHTFRPSKNKSSTAPTTTKNTDFAPSFITRGEKSLHERPSKEDICHDVTDDINPTISNASLDVGAFRQTFRRSKKRDATNPGSGYLTNRLYALRSNDQRMSMRLRSGQYSNTLSSTLLSRTRRRSGNGCLDPRNNATSELDVTVTCNIQPGCNNASAFGEGRTIFLAYVHRYSARKLGNEQFTNVEFPCFAWIILTQDVMREQGIVTGCSKQLRFYDATVIGPRVATPSVGLADSKKNQLLLPTIVCTQVCEQYPKELPPLPAVSFDTF